MSTPGTFEGIYAENYRSLYRVALKMVGDHDAASDIVQEVFISLFHRLRNGLDIYNSKNWLYKITYIKCMDHFRYRKRLKETELKDDIGTDDEATDDTALKEGIIRAVSRLRPRERVLVVLYSEGLSYKELAAATGIKLASIGKTLSRALQELGKELNKDSYELY